MKIVEIYRGDSVCLAILCEGGGPGAVSGQFGHNHSGCIGGHWGAGSEERRRDAGAEIREPAGTSRIWSKTAANPSLGRVPGGARRERLMGESAVLVAMSMTFLMASLSENGQGRKAHDSNFAEHLSCNTDEEFRPELYRNLHNLQWSWCSGLLQLFPGVLSS